jgi:hypothetical protein
MHRKLNFDRLQREEKVKIPDSSLRQALQIELEDGVILQCLLELSIDSGSV